MDFRESDRPQKSSLQMLRMSLLLLLLLLTPTLVKLRLLIRGEVGSDTVTRRCWRRIVDHRVVDGVLVVRGRLIGDRHD